jgi:hypothetical protein
MPHGQPRLFCNLNHGHFCKSEAADLGAAADKSFLYNPVTFGQGNAM